jgi:very-short-patch-repair endonuclease
MIIHKYNPENVKNAKIMRHDMTDAESLIWQNIKSKQLGFKFRGSNLLVLT